MIEGILIKVKFDFKMIAGFWILWDGVIPWAVTLGVAG